MWCVQIRQILFLFFMFFILLRELLLSYRSSFGPWSGLLPANPIMFTWSFTIIMSPTSYFGFRPPAAFVAIKWLTPTSFITRTGIEHWNRFILYWDWWNFKIGKFDEFWNSKILEHSNFEIYKFQNFRILNINQLHENSKIIKF